MKILIYNIGYCTGLTGRFREYLTKSYRYIFTSQSIQKIVLEELENLIHIEQPDVMSFIEIKNNFQFEYFSNEMYLTQDIESKYGQNNMFRNIPLLFKNRCNCLISTSDLQFEKHYLANGTKKLLYEIFLPNNISLYIMHFSLNKKVREKQFREIKEMVYTREVIIAGDFNIFRGVEELDELLKDSNLEIRTNFKTFPAYNPKKELDLVICSKHIKLNSKTINTTLSDHLPVVIDIDM